MSAFGKKRGNLLRSLYNKVNGQEKPFNWTTETIQINERQTKIIQRHTNPSVRDSGERKYTKIEITCTYTDR